MEHQCHNSDAQGADRDNSLRHLTILFSDLSSSVDLSAQMDCFDYVNFLHALRALFRTSIERHGGVIARLQGDGVLAVFGHDGSADDDGYRAICCALELHEAARAVSLGLGSKMSAALHTGIYSGPTYLESGDLERGRFDLIGNAPNLAARLSAVADRDAIFVTEEVITPHLHDFSVARRQELQIKGWSKPVMAFSVARRAERPEPAPKHAEPINFEGPSLGLNYLGADGYAF